MPNVKAEGQLRHGFHGTYIAVVGLGFTSEADAVAALATLGSAWKQGEKSKHCLVWQGSADELEPVKAKLATFSLTIAPCGWKHCKKKCKGAEIDSLAHSIDFGPRFYVEIPVVAAEQISLF